MSVPVWPEPVWEGISLVLIFLINAVDHHTIDTAVHLTLSVSPAYIYIYTHTHLTHLLPSKLFNTDINTSEASSQGRIVLILNSKITYCSGSLGHGMLIS